MFRLVLILLIALLPLRSWSVDRMDVGMALNESASHSKDMGASQGSMPEDCPMILGMYSDEGASHGKGQNESWHEACQLCMSLVATQGSTIKALTLPLQPYGIPRVEHYASAELLLFTKPPIY
jgi:hypothetical protein